VSYVGLAEVQYEWNALDQALHSALEGVKLAEFGGFTSYLLAGYARLVEIYLARRDLDAASRTFVTAERLAQRYDYPYIDGVLAGLRVRLWVAHGDLTAVREWLRGYVLGPAASVDLALEARYIAAVRALLATGQTGEALTLLGPVMAAAEANGRTGRLIELLVLQALTFQAQDDMKRSLVALEHALALAESEGYVRTFVDEGEPATRLLRRAVVDGIVPGYAGRLLVALEESWQQAPPAAQPFTEPLTEREMQVLRLVAAGLSNPEIAHELVIALSTVKSHINHIYGKLGVKNRMLAIDRARAMDLL
jgi:LuxR family maltose regulon positive regulatory protein